MSSRSVAPSLRRAAHRTRIPLLRTSFHSHQHPASASASASPPSPGPAELAILRAAYRHVPQHGFSRRALNLGARDAGYLDISPSVLPDGAFSLVRFHLETQRLALAHTSRALSGNQPGSALRSKVAAITWARLIANRDILHEWQDALAMMAQPGHLSDSLRELALLSDEILYLAGDESVDSSWYSKRASLSMIYSASELYMTTDRSPGFANTNRFLTSRLEEANLVGGLIGDLTTWTSFTANAAVNVLRSRGLPI
ncbi:uncharacterized protein UV8b_03054 [Ustilaginoidea virens]|nr:uncharacterized protein UV8b_03054 [Ustilaginoidea virens]QUC18813.1 hypothetical protein UV8b_03054 [Ustilaginoidea virens]